MFVKDSLDLARLTVVVVLDTWELGLEDDMADNSNLFIYDIYREVVRPLHSLKGLHHIQFDLGWFMGLEPIIVKAIMGEKYVDRHSEESIHIKSRDRPFFRVPTWYEANHFTAVDSSWPVLWYHQRV
jgi:hypothetical protein